MAFINTFFSVYVDKFIYGSLSKNKNKFLFISFKAGILTSWSLSHLIFFFIIGLICPNNLFFIILLGVLWEIYEFSMDFYKICLLKKKRCKKINKHINKLPKIVSKYINKCSLESKLSKSKFFNIYLGKAKDKNNHLYHTSGGINGQLFDILLDVFGYLCGANIIYASKLKYVNNKYK